MEKMTVQQYAKLRGIGDAAVRKAIKLGHGLPGVTRRAKFGKSHVLYVDKNKIEKDLQVTE